MDRRAYLTALGAAAAAVSGCSEGDNTGTASQTETADGTATPSERATATAEQPDPTPRVTDSGLRLDTDSFTSFDDIDSVGQGGILIVGVDYDLPVSDGSARGLVEARVHDSDGTELSTDSEEIDAVATGDSEFHSDSSWFAFDTSDQEQGSYTVELLINSEAHGTSTSTEVPFDIVEPLGEGEAEMYIAEFPDDAVAREEFEWTVGFRNQTDRDSSVVTDIVTIDPARADSFEIETQYRENIPARGETTVDKTLKANIPGTYTYRIDAIDAEVSFTVSPPEE